MASISFGTKKSKLTCPICKSKKPQKFLAMSGYKLARCQKCGMVWDPFSLESLEDQYDKSYFENDNPKGGYANYFEGMRINKKTFSDRLKRLEKLYTKKGKLLDVGCALGDCLLEARRLGWKEVEGLEVSPFACEFARKRGLKVKSGDLRRAGFLKASFDVITYQDVIEHIDDPLAELRIAKKILKSKGMIFLVTPDIDGFWHKVLGSLWYHFKPGEHVFYFSQKTLKLILEKAGFVNIKTRRTYHVLSIEYVLNRLKYYAPNLFGGLLKLAQKIGFGSWSFRVYTGEIEAWGYKV